ncbi:MAG: serine hydroxymethyltransferase [Candidatus Dojkabacteria bacterium]|nr:serine hydroxymethyltransferase [Candidatus Dojkabacteria bacterium]
MVHTKLLKLLEKEQERQKSTLDLIASENYTSKSVRRAVGSVFMHKYSEGYPGARYYEGNEFIDDLENLAIKMVKKVFKVDDKAWHVNVQPPSGSIANLAVYNAILKPGDKILAMYLPDGGHLSHGWSYTPTKERTKKEKEEMESSMVYYGGKKKLTLNSKIFNVVQYKTDPKTNLFDYDFIRKLAKKEKPKLIITGGTAYPREIDYKIISEIAKEVGAYYLADVAHEAGLIAGGAMNSPFDYVDFVTFTTHKTLRGPKGAVIMCRNEYADKIDRSVIPGFLGGPLNHTIAGITQALFEADTNEFKEYSARIIRNAKALGEELKKKGFDLVSGGTDKHLLVIDLTNKKVLGKKVSRALYLAGIVSNKTTVPYEKKSPINPSGIRLGTPSITTRGMHPENMSELANIISDAVDVAAEFRKLKFTEFQEELENDYRIKELREKVRKICDQFPIE